MKNKMKFRKKFIFAAVALTMVAGILTVDLAQNATVAEAKQNVFHSIATYQKSGLKVLEITPTDNDIDMGYYFKKTTQDDQINDVTEVTYGNILLKQIEGYSEQVQYQENQALLQQILTEARTYAENEAQAYATPIATAAARAEFADECQAWITANSSQWYAPSEDNYYAYGIDQQGNREAYKQFYNTEYDAAYNSVYQTYYDNKYAELLADSDVDTNLTDPGLNIDIAIHHAFILRSYGMIKPFQQDSWITTSNGTVLSEYPIYTASRGTFYYAAEGDGNYILVNIPTYRFIQGHYALSTTGTGAYDLADNYVIGTGSDNITDAVDENDNPIDSLNLDANYIYRRDEVTMDPGTTSGNGIVSGNGTGALTYYRYTKITTPTGLPEGIKLNANGTGNVDFVYLANKADIYYGYAVEQIRYIKSDPKFKMSDWFKEYVLGDIDLNCNITYTHATLTEINAGTYNVNDYDLIYISGTADEYAKVPDMSSAVVKQLFDASAINHKAVMMDYALYNDADGLTNLEKLALLLWQDDQLKVAVDYANCFAKDADTGEITEISDIDGLLGSDAMNALKGTKLNGYNGNFAINNVYVYNHHWQDFQNSRLAEFQKDALDIFANGDLKTPYDAAAVSGGFQSVVAYITYNNNLNITDDGNGKMTEGYVTPAIAIQYILSYGGEDLALTKNVFTVLEIQPTKEFKFNSSLESKEYTLETAEIKANRNEFIETCIDEKVVESGTQDFITFDSVTVDQFNTMQLDVIHDYDIVYIGDENSLYYEHVEGTIGVVNTKTDSIDTKTDSITYTPGSITAYNDAKMNGSVYFNYGDKVSTVSSLNEYYASRDLTEAKLIDLKNYLQGGGLIIADKDLMQSTSKGNVIINPTAAVGSDDVEMKKDHGRMDPASNMYELFKFARGYVYQATVSGQYIPGATGEDGEIAGVYYNLVSEGDLASGLVSREDLLVYLNRERASLRMLSEPAPYYYSAGSSESYLPLDTKDGKYYLDYEFVIDNSTAIVDASDLYLVHFYQDVNADGRFAATEEKFDFDISLVADESAVAGVKGEDGITRYNLNNGVAYKLRREVPSDEGGIINWCIKVEKMANPSINCSETGFTAIRPKNQKYINVLQIVPDGDNATINLEELTEADELYTLMYDPAVTNEYLITVRTVTVSQFEKDTQNYYSNFRPSYNSSEALWQEYFATFERTEADAASYTQKQIDADEDKPMNVNMIILGFGENYTQFNTNFPTDALKSYMETNRPLLTSNDVVDNALWKTVDTVQDGQTVQSIVWNENGDFLSYFGQDRYGYTNPIYNQSNLNKSAFSDRDESVPFDEYIMPRETNNQALAYMHGEERTSVHTIPEALTNSVRCQFRTSSADYEFIKASSVNTLYQGSDPTANATHTYVDMANEGQVSIYPYTIGDDVLLSKTHAQNFQLDLDSDSDKDGNSDIIVWYTLSDMAIADGTVDGSADIYSVTPVDGINNYYIYNNGNVTFTGFGSKDEKDITTKEAQLFVNTLIAAYEAGLVNPTVSYYQTADPASPLLESIAVPYDKNVVERSSVLFDEIEGEYEYQFVNPNQDLTTAEDGTKVFFKVQDSNLVKSEKHCKVTFYLEVEDNEAHIYQWPDGTRSWMQNIQLSDNTVVNVVQIPIRIYESDFSKMLGTSTPRDTSANPTLEVGKMYGMYAPMSYLADMGAAKIYIKADTSYTVLGSTGQWVERPLGTAFDMFTEIKQDLLKLD